MDWYVPVFDYCERRTIGLWAEPLNALSNVAFLFAAVAALSFWRRRQAADHTAFLLILVTFAIGAGSFIFHTVATQGAMLLDIAPIALFIYLYFFVALRRFLGLGPMPAAAATALFATVSQLVNASAHVLNGSIVYLLALGALIFFSAVLSLRARALPGSTQFAAAAGRLNASVICFAISLGFRTVDRALCAAFPAGTHFIWHLLNAVTLWLLIEAAIFAGEAQEDDQRVLQSDKPNPKGEEAHCRMGGHDRQNITGEEISRRPGDACEKGVDQ